MTTGRRLATTVRQLKYRGGNKPISPDSEASCKSYSRGLVHISEIDIFPFLFLFRRYVSLSSSILYFTSGCVPRKAWLVSPYRHACEMSLRAQDGAMPGDEGPPGRAHRLT
jgi:hypothetical protein